MFHFLQLLSGMGTDEGTYRAKAIWDFEGIYCSSRHIPHVKFPGLIHPGILGCAPSAEVSLKLISHLNISLYRKAIAMESN